MTNFPRQNGRLWLEVESEPYDVKCDNCNGSKEILDKSTVNKATYEQHHPCFQCNGTGTRSVRLVGCVEIVHVRESYFRVEPPRFDTGVLEHLTQRVISKHRSKYPLPIEFYADPSDPADTRLREVDA